MSWPSRKLVAEQSKVARVEHHAALLYRDLLAFMMELRQQEGVAARTGEVIDATWAEIDWEARLWTISSERMKAGREHRVPFRDGALAVLRPLYEVRTGDKVFPLSNMAMLMLMGRGSLTVHGFRSAVSDWCAERTAFPSEVREMALAHTVGDKVEAAYRRGDLFEKRRQVMDAWSRFCSSPASAEAAP